ncbi:MAG: sulfatase-like hydrolase/transferase [Pseudomonadota bacterium]
MRFRLQQLFILTAISALLGACGGSDTRAPTQPHVIWITAGDLALEDLSVYGGPIPTPNMERIAALGVTFDTAYAAAAQAGPARAALVTGRYPQRFGFTYDLGPVRPAMVASSGMPDNAEMIQDRLRALGYTTALFGSWSLGARTEFYPMRRGFDDFWGTLGDSTSYIAPRAENAVFTKTPNYRLPPSRSRFDMVFVGPMADTVQNFKRYLTDDMGEEVARYIRLHFAGDITTREAETAAQDAPKPLFLWASFHAPRVPLTALKSDFDGLPDLGSEERNTYGAMVRALDRNIGLILDTLEDSGALEDAIIVFSADRGCDAVAGTCPCGTLRGGASSFREGGIRIPLIVTFPGGEQAGTRIDLPIISLDIAATVMDYADLEDRLIPEFEGRSLREILDGKTRRFETRPLYWEQTPLIAIRMDGKKLLQDGQNNRAALYDLTTDPREQTDLADDNRYLVSDLETRLSVWQQSNIFPAWETSKYEPLMICGETEFVVQADR